MIFTVPCPILIVNRLSQRRLALNYLAKPLHGIIIVTHACAERRLQAPAVLSVSVPRSDCGEEKVWSPGVQHSLRVH